MVWGWYFLVHELLCEWDTTASVTDQGQVELTLGKEILHFPLILFFFLLDSEDIFEDIIQYLQDTMSREQLELLLTEKEAWESFVAEADLSR